MLFENPPTAFNRVVFAVIRWIICETDIDVILLDKFQQTLHELGAPTVVLWSIIQIENERGNLRKALSDALPPIDQTIYQTITGHFGGHPIEKDFIESG